MKLKGVILIIVALYHLSFSQDFDNYTPLTSTGEIPKDFNTISSEAFEEATEGIDKRDKEFDRKSQKKFHLQNSFNLHELIYSGKLIFNDELSVYANKVLDQILINDKNLRIKLRIYIVKTPYVNAFATNNGIILINEGLLAQLENEAQLAFVLCHEVTHFTKKHIIKQYVEKERIVSGNTKESYKKSSKQLFAINKYSKETEKEADEIGFELYKKSKYDFTQLDGVFDVLEYAYLPFDEEPFDISFLETEMYKFPRKYLPDTSKLKSLPVSSDDDSLSTHPSVKKRRSYIKNAIKDLDNTGRAPFLVASKEDFLKIRKIARYELVSNYINDAKYFEALYCIYLLQKEEPQSNYLKKSKAVCLYGIAKYKNANKYSGNIVSEYTEVFGESQVLHYFLNSISSKEFSIYVLKVIWNLKIQHNEDALYEKMAEDMMRDIAMHHFGGFNEFEKSYPSEQKDFVADSSLLEKASKYETVKKKLDKQSDGDMYYQYAFVEELKNPDFIDSFDRIVKEFEKEEEYENSIGYKKEKARYDKTINKRGYRLGIDKIVLASPFCLHVDERKKDQIRYLDSEKAEKNFLHILNNNASKCKLQMEVLDDIDVKNMTTDKYNDFTYINQWFSIRSRENRNDLKLMDLNRSQTDTFIKKYGTKYVCWMGTIATREKKEWIMSAVLCSLLIYPAPFLLPPALSPKYYTYFYTIVYDVEKGKMLAFRSNLIDRNDSNGQINSIVYDTFFQIRNKK